MAQTTSQSPKLAFIPANARGLSYTSAMHSEILYILFLIAPWALVLIALLFYRKRRKRKALNDSGGGRDGGDGGIR